MYRFVVKDANEEYTYHLGICTTAVAVPTGDISEAGILQLAIKNGKNQRIIGKFVSSEITIGCKSMVRFFTALLFIIIRGLLYKHGKL